MAPLIPFSGNKLIQPGVVQIHSGQHGVRPNKRVDGRRALRFDGY